MKQRIIYLLLCITMGFSLIATTSCTSKERQLDAALKAANKGFPQQVGNGVVVEGMFMEDDNIDIAVTVAESAQTIEITQERMEELHKEFVMIFTQVAHQTKEFHDFLQLVRENGKTMSMSITLMPSKKKQSIQITDEEIVEMLEADKKSPMEMARKQLDVSLAAEQQQFPINLGPLVIQSVERTETDVLWKIDVNDSLIFAAMTALPEEAKRQAIDNLSKTENASLNRVIINADCNIIYRYTDKATGKVFDLKVTKKELRDIQKNSVSTKIEK